MARLQREERRWTRIEAMLASERGAGRPPINDRNFIEAVLWWRRTGVPWRDLPDEFGPWNTVFNRFDRWSKTGKWNRLFQALQTDRDDEWHSIDSTINRAHQHAAGGKGAAAQGIGRSRGGLSTKVHLVTDALGLPLTFEISEGQRHDIRPAKELVARVLSRCLLADKAYDSAEFRTGAQRAGLRARDPVERKSCREATLRQRALQGALRDRVHIQPAQAGASLRYSV